MVNIHMMKAFEGDFLWISYGDMENIYHVLVDGGVKACGEKYAKILNEIADANQLVEAIILTHIDCDHIAGVCEGIAKVTPEVLQKVVKRIIFNASEEIHKEIKVTNSFGGYGVKEGIQFLEILEMKGIKKRLINNVISGQIITLEDDAVLKIISPGEKQLIELFDKWERYQEKHDAIGYACNTDNLKRNLVDLKSALTGTDNSINNASSIAFLFEYQDVKGAFLADAKPLVCLEGLKKFDIEERYQVDFIKISHHGSIANTNLKLLKVLCAENYLLSTDGHGKKTPSKVMIAKLIRNCEEKNKTKVSIYCNYNWWETIYHNKYFTEVDKKMYIDTRIRV